MGVPKRKVSKSRRDQRSASKGIKPQSVGACAHCDYPSTGHHACTQCGYYKGRQVVVTKLERAVERTQVRQAVAQKRAERQSAGAADQSVSGTQE